MINASATDMQLIPCATLLVDRWEFWLWAGLPVLTTVVLFSVVMKDEQPSAAAGCSSLFLTTVLSSTSVFLVLLCSEAGSDSPMSIVVGTVVAVPAMAVYCVLIWFFLAICHQVIAEYRSAMSSTYATRKARDGEAQPPDHHESP